MCGTVQADRRCWVFGRRAADEAGRGGARGARAPGGHRGLRPWTPAPNRRCGEITRVFDGHGRARRRGVPDTCAAPHKVPVIFREVR